MEIALHIMMLLGAVGLFLFGMKMMSDTLQRASGQRLYSQLNRVAGSPLRGILLATTTTAIIQSSSAMTVMIVGLTHAGLLNLGQAIGMIMGANIGTTATAWLVALFGIQLDFSLLATPLIAVSFPLLLAKRNRLRNLGSTLIGLSLILLALHLLREATGHLMAQAPVEKQLAQLDNYGFWSPLLFFLAGTIMTIILQSSSATTALAIVLCSSGAISLENAMALILGDNLGTTATANIAAIMTNAAGKRVALAHLFFNLVSVLWALPLLSPITQGINQIIILCGGNSPLITGIPSTAIVLALFHTLLNVTTTILLAGFIPQAAKLLEQLIPNKSKTSGNKPDTDIPTPAGELGLLQTTYNFAQSIRRDKELLQSLKTYFKENNVDTASALAAEISLQINNRENENRLLDRQLTQLAQHELSPKGHLTWQCMNRLIIRQQTVTDLCKTALRLIQLKKQDRLWFTQPMRKILEELFAIIDESYDLTRSQLTVTTQIPPETIDLQKTRLDKLGKQWIQIKTELETTYLIPNNHSEITQPTILIFIELANCISQLTGNALQIAEETTTIAFV